MIYNQDFIWLHFPKCAGTKVADIFRKYFSKTEGLIQDPVGAKADPTIAWHDAVSDRRARDPGFDPGEKTIVISFRRLLPWLISRYSFEVQRSPYLDHNPELLLEGKFFEANGRQSHADHYIRKYLPEPVLKSGRVQFIRTEYFESDFKNVFGAYLDISKIPDKQYTIKVNTSKNYLPPDSMFFLQRQKHTIYDNCPLWRAVEEMAYGQVEDFLC